MGIPTASKPAPAPRLEGDHFQRLIRLVDVEAEAAARQLLERLRRAAATASGGSGESLRRLVVGGEGSGLGGRALLTFTMRDPTRRLPWNRFQVGAPVLVSEEGSSGDSGARGVVCARSDRFLEIALTELPEEQTERPSYRVDISFDEIGSQRQKAALERARTASGNRLAELRQVLMGETEAEFGPPAQQAVGPPPALDASQLDAVAFALSARDLAVIHGPPGTGKTTAVVELIRQAVRRGEKVLACAPSNLAVDNMLERLVAAGARAIRVGHPARVLPELRAHTLDQRVEVHPDTRLARSFYKEAHALYREAGKFTRARPEPGARRDMRRRARELKADARRLEAQVVERLLGQANVVLATLTGLDPEVLGALEFDLAIIDEACQAIEPACWLPLLRARRVVLAGDHCQLPPTVVSAEAARDGLSVSLLERIVGLCGSAVTRRLRVQYRMHEAIMQFSSTEFYDGALQAAASVRARRLCDLPGVARNSCTMEPIQFVDTAGAGHEEQLDPDGESRLNPEEAAIVRLRVEALLESGVLSGDIGVITPYAAQARLLRELLAVEGLEIDTVDGFQGREKEAIVISLVRSNSRGEIGFLSDVRRMNVALTRARCRLVVIGDSATLSTHPFYGRLLEYFEKAGAYSTVWDDLRT